MSCLLMAGAAFLLCRCCGRCRIRDCSICKKMFRVLRIDKFSDTKINLVVSEASWTGDYEYTQVRVTAGDEVVSTEVSDDGNYRQGFEFFIAQGTSVVLVELLDDSGNVLANLPLDPLLDLRMCSGQPGFDKQALDMDDVATDITRARIVLAIYDQSFAEDSRFHHILDRVDQEDRILVEQQLLQTYHANYGSADEDPDHAKISEFELARKTCSGPVHVYGGWGSKREVYIAVLGPPQCHDWTLGVWETKEAYDGHKDAQERINLLRVLSVQAEPTRQDVFVINFMVTKTQRQRLVMERIDRSRDVWVDMIKIVVDYVHERRARRQQHRKGHHAA